MTALIQNFSVPADNDVTVPLKIDPSLGLTSLAGTVYWRAYEQSFGIPNWDVPSGTAALIQKSSTDGSITETSPAAGIHIHIHRGDTEFLLRNYYHEATLVDLSGHVSTLCIGIMTVTESMSLF